MRKNATNETDYREKFGYPIGCEKYNPPSKEAFFVHRRKCAECTLTALEVGDFIKCPYCEFSSSNILYHLKKVHSMDIEDVKKSNISYISLNSIERNSISVSKSIMNNEEERKRRSKLLAKLNKTEEFRKKASETAINSDIIVNHINDALDLLLTPQRLIATLRV